ncbi:MAG: glycosyltransferase family 2 protein [Fibrobacteraceae bacterium]|nr:glycosyltransferase family 2 protein [Fibrobacteraceae bacterium]
MALEQNFDTFIFVPAYNVGERLWDVLGKVSRSVKKRSRILVVDDGSKDQTGEVAQRIVSQSADNGLNIAYIRFEKNRGYGAVVKEGIRQGLESGAKYIACLHGDNQYPAEYLDEFLAAMECHPLALLQGSRCAIDGDAKKGGMPLHKRIGGAFLTSLENLVYSQRLTDRHSGFLVYSSDFLKTVDLEKLSPSFDIDLELISIADAANVPVAELPIPTRYSGEKSNLSVVDYGIRVIGQIIRRIFR